MQHFQLKGQERKAEGKAVIKAFRKQGLVPCNLYGEGLENVLFTVSEKDLKGLLFTPKSFIIDVELGGKTYTAVLHELQFHPVTDACLHVDLLAVSEKKPISINVPLVISGHAIGVQQGGKFYQNARKLRISALMKDLPDDLTIDITKLGLDKKIKAGDLKFDNISILTDKDTVVCGVRTTRNTAAVASAEGEAAE
ncbi:MAG: 50S ribosomal protein L25 [Bacteroidales bacterium]|nr:50S ribosomal protein L25 [Bacteroidales bacterium]